MSELLGKAEHDSIWECYSPDFAAPACHRKNHLVRPNFVGWSGLGPFVMLPEDILGLDIDALSNRIEWHLGEKGAQALTGIPFNGGTVDLELDVADDFSFTGHIRTDRPFALRILSPGHQNDCEFEIAPGNHAL